MFEMKLPLVMAGAVSALASEYGRDSGKKEGGNAQNRLGANDGGHLTVLHS